MGLRAEMEQVRLVRRLLQVAHQVVDRGLVGQVGEDDAEPPAQVADVVERARGGCAHEGDHVRVELDERVREMGAHEPVGAGDEARPPLVGLGEVAPKLVDLVRRPDDGIFARHPCRLDD